MEPDPRSEEDQSANRSGPAFRPTFATELESVAPENEPAAEPGPLLPTLVEPVRLPNVFTAVSGAAAGALVSSADARALGGVIVGLSAAAAALMYSGGVALNDAFDAALDARERPNRPIPSGRITRTAAFRFGLGLLAAGVASGMLAAALAERWQTAIVVVLLATGIVLYDGWANRLAIGPVVMGGCRALNVLMGLTAGVAPWRPAYALIAVAVATYIAGITWFARRESEASSRFALACAAMMILLGVALWGLAPQWDPGLFPRVAGQSGQWWLMFALLGMLTAWRCASAIANPMPLQVQTTVAHAILTLILFDAVMVFAARGMAMALPILLLLLPAMLLRRRYAMS